MRDMCLETERLVIRPLSQKDAQALHAVVSQKEVVKYLPEGVMSLAEVRQTIAWLCECYERNRPDKIIKFTLGVAWKANGVLIGWCGLGPLEFNPSEVEIFYGLSRRYWGRGLATEAAEGLLGYAFERLKLSRVVAVTSAENTASVRVIEKLGMANEKKVTDLPEEHCGYEGVRYYALTRDEYLRRRAAR